MSDLEELVAVSQVVMGDMNVSSLLIIVATVVVASSDSRPFLGIRSHKVDVWVGVDLCLLQGGQLRSVQSQSLFRSERATQLCGDPSVPNSVWTGGVSGALTGFSAVANKYDRHIIMNKSPFFCSGRGFLGVLMHLSFLPVYTALL